MHAGAHPALDAATGPLGPDPMITLLDGGLGAVADPFGPIIETPGATLCWCGCFICHVGEPESADGAPRSA